MGLGAVAVGSWQVAVGSWQEKKKRELNRKARLRTGLRDAKDAKRELSIDD